MEVNGLSFDDFAINEVECEEAMGAEHWLAGLAVGVVVGIAAC